MTFSVSIEQAVASRISADRFEPGRPLDDILAYA
ncbi:Uncharacterised protein [Delftia tsuruhatensis]|nr:Uncharacterised protein [Delftia tsuruhatensis]CAC9682309.1 Uncharacterised protein [Delftia tsuruhatensis]